MRNVLANHRPESYVDETLEVNQSRLSVRTRRFSTIVEKRIMNLKWVAALASGIRSLMYKYLNTHQLNVPLLFPSGPPNLDHLGCHIPTPTLKTKCWVVVSVLDSTSILNFNGIICRLLGQAPASGHPNRLSPSRIRQRVRGSFGCEIESARYRA